MLIMGVKMTNILEMVERNKILECITGSRAYGINTPKSDTDIRGIFIPDKDFILGTKRVDQYESPNEDLTFYALQRYIQLARDANPNILEVLWTEEKNIKFINKYGKKLVENKSLFLSKKVRHTYSGYAFSQLKRIQGHKKWLDNPPEKPKEEDFHIKKGFNTVEGEHIVLNLFDESSFREAVKNYENYLKWVGNRNPTRKDLEAKYKFDVKHGAHLVRLMNMAVEILTEGTIYVLRPDRDFLKQIRNGEYSYEYLLKWAEDKEKFIEEAYIRSSLPHSPDDEAINKLQIEILEEFLYSK